MLYLILLFKQSKILLCKEKEQSTSDTQLTLLNYIEHLKSHKIPHILEGRLNYLLITKATINYSYVS